MSLSCCSTRDRSRSASSTPAPRFTSWTGIEVSDPRHIAALRRLFREQRIDLVHVHGYKATIAGGIAARSCGIAALKTEHGQLEPPGTWREMLPHLRMRANIWLDRLATRCLMRTVVCVSRDILETGGTERRGGAVLIHNGIERSRAAAGLESRPLPGFDPRHFHVGIIGRLAPVKGHRYLVEAVRRLAHLEDLRLHIVGTGPLEAACRDQCRDAGLTERVVFHGFRTDVEACLRHLHVVAIPSLHEGLPYTLLEAMQLRVPVVASNVGGLREVLEQDACGILVPPADPAALAGAIERLYGNPDLRASLAEAGYQRMRRSFSAGDMQRKYVGLYRQLVAKAS